MDPHIMFVSGGIRSPYTKEYPLFISVDKFSMDIVSGILFSAISVTLKRKNYRNHDIGSTGTTTRDFQNSCSLDR